MKKQVYVMIPNTDCYYGITAISTFTLPYPWFIRSKSTTFNLNLFTYHKCWIKSNPKLTYYINIFFLFFNYSLLLWFAFFLAFHMKERPNRTSSHQDICSVLRHMGKSLSQLMSKSCTWALNTFSNETQKSWALSNTSSPFRQMFSPFNWRSGRPEGTTARIVDVVRGIDSEIEEDGSLEIEVISSDYELEEFEEDDEE